MLNSFKKLLSNAESGIYNAKALIGRNVKGAIEKINPYDDQSRGQQLLQNAANRYNLAPNFQKLISSQNPHYGGDSLDNNSLVDAKATGTYTHQVGRNPFSTTGLKVASSSSAPIDALLHEGLHAEWDANPNARTKFIDIYNRSATPELRKYLVGRTQDYKSASGLPEDAFIYADKMPESLQDEVRSYTSDYLRSTSNRIPGLSEYYDQYYTPQKDDFRRLMGGGNGGGGW